jgi:membrane protease YdiL (CAAX protease family)
VETTAPAPVAPVAPPWKGRVFLPVLALFCAFVAAAVVAAVAVAAGAGNQATGAVAELAFYGALGGLALRILHGLPEHEQRQVLAWKGPPRRVIALGVAIGIAFVIGSGIVIAIGEALDSSVRHRLDDVSPDVGGGWTLAVTIVAFVVLAPFIEELVFRGLILRGLARRMRFGYAALLSGAMFAASHADSYIVWPRAVQLLIAGVCLALVYRSLGYAGSVTVHATLNAVAAIGLALS